MLIKAGLGGQFIYTNLDKVFQFKPYHECHIEFRFTSEKDSEYMFFSSKEKRDKAIEKILDAYRWERKICDLTEEG